MSSVYLSQAACAGGVLYTIRPGDTLNALSSRFGSTVSAIIAANPGINPYNLQVGQTICVPGATPPATCPGGRIYTVRAGDTFYLIAQSFGITLAALIAANPGVDPARLAIGQTICVPVAPPPRPGICMIGLRAENQPYAGVLLAKDAIGGGNPTVTFTAVDLPEPATFGNFDAYIGQVNIFTGAQFSYTILLGRVPLADQPVTWAGSRVVPQGPSMKDVVEVRPYGTSRGISGDPVLSGLTVFCS